MEKNKAISWDKYFMGIALLSAKRSKDPNTQVGACIVNDRKRIVGIKHQVATIQIRTFLPPILFDINPRRNVEKIANS